jgi:hypothetical protein
MAKDGLEVISLPELTTDASGDATQKTPQLDGNWFLWLVVESTGLDSGGTVKVMDTERSTLLCTITDPTAGGIYPILWQGTSSDASASGEYEDWRTMGTLTLEVESGGDAKAVKMHVAHQDEPPWL